MKPGYKTTEFWIMLLAAAIPGVLAFLKTIDTEWAVSCVTILAAIYAVLRSSLKAKTGN